MTGPAENMTFYTRYNINSTYFKTLNKAKRQRKDAGIRKFNTTLHVVNNTQSVLKVCLTRV